jgi:hypothetical protein
VITSPVEGATINHPGEEVLVVLYAREVELPRCRHKLTVPQDMSLLQRSIHLQTRNNGFNPSSSIKETPAAPSAT